RRIVESRYFGPSLARPFLCNLLSQRHIQQVTQPNTRALQPIPDEWNVLFQIRGIHDDHFLVLALREGLVPLLIDAFRADANAVLQGLPSRDLEGPIRPARNRHRHPRGPVAISDALHEVTGHALRVCPQLLLNDADVPDRVEAVHARPAFPNEVTF